MDNTQVANRIKELCKLKGSSVSKMLEVCNIRKSLIYDLEKRNASPSIEVIGQIADYLNCSVDYLFGRTDNPNVSGNYINGDNNGIQAIKNRGSVTIRQTAEKENNCKEIEVLLEKMPRSKQLRAIADIIDLLEEKYMSEDDKK